MLTGNARKAEDTAIGCREKSEHDRLLAESEVNPRMRERLQSSAAVWAARASLLQRLEAGRIPQPAVR